MDQDALTHLVREIRRCKLCLEFPSGPPLGHDPNPVLQVSKSARILIAGQAPGTRVHASSKPFTDPSGDRLRNWLGIGEEIFYDETRIAILPMGFCFPGLDAKGGDLPPRRECAPAWRAQVLSLLPDIKLVLVIGQYAQKWHLASGRGKTLTATVQNWRHHLKHNSPPVLPLPHPSWRNNAWLKKNPWFGEDVIPHLQSQVKHLVGE